MIGWSSRNRRAKAMSPAMEKLVRAKAQADREREIVLKKRYEEAISSEKRAALERARSAIGSIRATAEAGYHAEVLYSFYDECSGIIFGRYTPKSEVRREAVKAVIDLASEFGYDAKLVRAYKDFGNWYHWNVEVRWA